MPNETIYGCVAELQVCRTRSGKVAAHIARSPENAGEQGVGDRVRDRSGRGRDGGHATRAVRAAIRAPAGPLRSTICSPPRKACR